MKPVIKYLLKPIPFVILATIMFFIAINIEKRIIAKGKASLQTESQER
jgi:hypothetical protein